MNIKMRLIVDTEDEVWLVNEAEDASLIRVVTVSEAVVILKVSRRQIYRYLDKKLLKTYGKLCGDWLIDLASVEALKRTPLSQQPIPASKQYLFPEYDIKELNAGRDAPIVVSRILEHGDVDDIRWLLNRYSRRLISDCIAEHGGRLLSRKSLRLWCLVFDIKEPISWRQEENPWQVSDEVA